MPFVALASLIEWRGSILAIEDELALHLDDETIHRALRMIRRRLEGYIDVAKTREPQGLMNEEIAVHGLEIPDEHPTNRFIDKDTDEIGPY